MSCACADQCQLGTPATSAHKECPDCRRFIHAICGLIITDSDNKYNNQWCSPLLTLLTRSLTRMLGSGPAPMAGALFRATVR
eukprot:scaffold40115_cov58-Attheya_sp.AAC.1